MRRSCLFFIQAGYFLQENQSSTLAPYQEELHPEGIWLKPESHSIKTSHVLGTGQCCLSCDAIHPLAREMKKAL